MLWLPAVPCRVVALRETTQKELHMLQLSSGESRERRMYPRLRIERSAKVYNPLTRRYYPARTIDMCRSGAMISVSSPRTLLPGDQIEVAICWDDRVLIPQDSLMKAEVTRVVVRMGEHQAVGVRFLEQMPLAAAA